MIKPNFHFSVSCCLQKLQKLARAHFLLGQGRRRPWPLARCSAAAYRCLAHFPAISECLALPNWIFLLAGRKAFGSIQTAGWAGNSPENTALPPSQSLTRWRVVAKRKMDAALGEGEAAKAWIYGLKQRNECLEMDESMKPLKMQPGMDEPVKSVIKPVLSKLKWFNDCGIIWMI